MRKLNSKFLFFALAFLMMLPIIIKSDLNASDDYRQKCKDLAENDIKKRDQGQKSAGQTERIVPLKPMPSIAILITIYHKGKAIPQRY